MRKIFLVLVLIVGTLLLESFAIAQEASVADESAGTAAVETPKVESKSFVRTVGSKWMSPGLKKQASLASSAKAFAPGQVKKVAGFTSAKSFVRRPAEITATRKQVFDEIAKKAKPQKPLKGQKKSFRGEPYKPVKVK